MTRSTAPSESPDVLGFPPRQEWTAESTSRALIRGSLIQAERILVKWATDPVTLLQSLLFPAIMVLMFWLVLDRSVSDYSGSSSVFGMVPMVALVGAMSGASISGLGLRRERTSGLLTKMWVLPVHRASAMVGRLLAEAVRVVVTVLVLAGPANPPSQVKVVRVPWLRNERSAVAGLKTLSYVENAVVLAHAQAKGADEALLANTVGELCEGTATNVFVERAGELLTPPLDSGCLAGITRELVLEWAADAGLPVREAARGELPYAVLDDVAAGRVALALTGSVRTVAPVVSLDGVPVAPGPLTARVREIYVAREADDVDP